MKMLQGLKPLKVDSNFVAAEAATHKAHLQSAAAYT
jgi:hypothetical protein